MSSQTQGDSAGSSSNSSEYKRSNQSKFPNTYYYSDVLTIILSNHIQVVVELPIKPIMVAPPRQPLEKMICAQLLKRGSGICNKR